MYSKVVERGERQHTQSNTHARVRPHFGWQVVDRISEAQKADDGSALPGSAALTFDGKKQTKLQTHSHKPTAASGTPRKKGGRKRGKRK